MNSTRIRYLIFALVIIAIVCSIGVYHLITHTAIPNY
jgi:hypothetical protein